MKIFFKLSIAIGLSVLYALPSNAGENPLFGYTHLLSSPYTLRAGRIVLGSEAAMGLTDFLQVETNVILDFYQTYNASAKISVLDFPSFALALTAGWTTYNYRNFSITNPNIQVMSWLPGIVTAYELLPTVALFVGGNLNISKTTILTDTIETSGFFRGASSEADLSWAYNPKKKTIGNILSAGVSYDFSYRISGLGVSHHWRGFHLGIHYYPNATTTKVLPIISGGMAVDI